MTLAEIKQTQNELKIKDCYEFIKANAKQYDPSSLSKKEYDKIKNKVYEASRISKKIL